jgi:aspartate/glutamate racemase
MSGRFYPDVFSNRGIAVVPPRPREQEEIHDLYTTELIKGVVVPESCSRLLTIARRLRDDEDIQAVILAGTELPPALRECGDESLQFLDPSVIHVRAAIDRMLES